MKQTLLTATMLLCGIIATAQNVGDEIRALIPEWGSVYRHGYEALDKKAKERYEDIVEALCHFEANNASPYYFHRCDLPMVDPMYSIYNLIDDLERIQRDVPEMYILSSTVPRSDYSTGMYYARVAYVNTPEKYLAELKQLNEIATTLLAPIEEGMTEYERLRIIHDGFINWGDYGDMVGADAGNIRGALINKRAVCEGFARAAVYLCQRAGLKCIYVTGQLRTSSVNDSWGNHAWNFVEVDGQWYLMDLTSDGGFPGICGYTAFLRGQDYFAENYHLTSSEGVNGNLEGVYASLPELAATTYNPIPTGENNLNHNLNDSQSHNYDLQGRPMLKNKGIGVSRGRTILYK